MRCADAALFGERRGELSLDRTDALADGRGDERLAGRRAGDVALLADRDEQTQRDGVEVATHRVLVLPFPIRTDQVLKYCLSRVMEWLELPP